MEYRVETDAMFADLVAQVTSPDEAAVTDGPPATNAGVPSDNGESPAPPPAPESAAPATVDALTPETQAPAGDDRATTPEAAPPATTPEVPATPVVSEQELQALRESHEALQGINARLAAAETAQRVQAIREEINFISDEDPVKAQRLIGLLTNVAVPLNERITQAETQTQQMGKVAAVLHRAMTLHVPKEQIEAIQADFERLMPLEDFGSVERAATTWQTDRTQTTKMLSEKDAEIARLKDQIAAGSEIATRSANGVDAVPGAPGGASQAEDGSDAQLLGIVGGLFNAA